MNPTSTSGPELQLPTPLSPNVAYEQAPMPAQQQPEQAAAVAELLPLPQAPQPSYAGHAVAPTTMPTGQYTQVNAVSTTTNVVVPDVADDQDLIEKEWVSKAKQIVEKTRNDPYQQSQELTVFKSEYMQKRYNKSIKMSE
jgi:hypothetical protein